MTQPMQTTPSVALRLGRYVSECTQDVLPADVLDKAGCCLLDAMGLAGLARSDASVLAMAGLLTPIAPGPRLARTWTDGQSAPLTEVVALNALAAHAQFHDDTCYASWTHPGSLVVPAAVSLGESLGSSLTQVLRAIVAGYGCMAWLGANEEVALALIGRGVRTSPTLGTVGAAAAGASLLGLDAPRAAHAVAMAAGITGGVLEAVRTGSDEWRLQNAHAARGGVLAAQMAAGGLQGAPTAFEGPKGLLRAYAGLEHPPAAWAVDPDPAAILGIVAKPFATLGDNMAAVIASQLLVLDGVDVAAIERIEVTLWRPYADYPGTSYRGPFDHVGQALASTAFAVAAMLLFGELDYVINRDRRQDSRVLDLVQRIRVLPDDDGGPETSIVTLTLKDGIQRRRSASEADATLLHHDRSSATRLLAERLARTGRPSEQAMPAASLVFDRATGSPSINELVDVLLASKTPTPNATFTKEITA